MQRILSRSLWIQRKFISRYTKVHRYEMVLYNERPETSLVLRFNEERKLLTQQELHQLEDVEPIKSRTSKILCLFQSNYFVIHTHSDRIINTLVTEERIKNAEMAEINLVDRIKWLAKSSDSDKKGPVPPGTRLGRLDAANEAGFFHRTNRSMLREIKKKLKDKVDTEPTVPKKGG